ncbi:hypothetical protein GPECTOR_75g727 [Gonium pectorale]|uniref:Glucosamine 6-phosphate N-acetyltransferase n=1 Tax=Gonium pectorale TaxID=33097 RepID=A0A150G2F7_GONPE|nr:hypothetical protein GPECTOR_75g727 [Gonium pectorale]|eukprot:KXZ44003.1 hypothetical protein GPECTOR_75g727 [Gonium pectorale]
MATEFTVRPLQASDYDKEQFKRKEEAGSYRTVVIEDGGRIIATAAMVIELKFIRGCGKVGHIEDVVVDPEYRGKRLGAMLIDALVDAAREAGCYKVILDCAEANVGFYTKCGLTRKEVQMVRYLDR